MRQIERKDYMDILIGLRDKNLIKVLTGVRRCGKSYCDADVPHSLTERGGVLKK